MAAFLSLADCILQLLGPAKRRGHDIMQRAVHEEYFPSAHARKQTHGQTLGGDLRNSAAVTIKLQSPSQRQIQDPL